MFRSLAILAFCGEVAFQALQTFAGCDAELGVGYRVESEPADRFALVGLADNRCATPMAAKVGRRHPVLLFVGQDMIDHIEEPDHLDLDPKLLVHLALQGVFERFPELNAPSRKFPPVLLVPGLVSALCQEDLAGIVEYDSADPDANMIYTLPHGRIITSFHNGVYNHLAIEIAVRYNPGVGGAKERTWYLYILQCRDRTLYTGVTTDVDRRLEMHRKGTASKYTRSRLPVKLVHQEVCTGRADALRKEHAIKMLSRAEKEAYIRGPWTTER